MFQIFKIVKVMVGSGRDVQWCVLNCYLWLPETESFPFSGWTALRVAFFIQYLSRVCSLTIIFCCWYTTETAGSSYVYCGMADKIAMILTMWVLYSYLLEKTDFKNWNGGVFLSVFYQQTSSEGIPKCWVKKSTSGTFISILYMKKLYILIAPRSTKHSFWFITNFLCFL